MCFLFFVFTYLFTLIAERWIVPINMRILRAADAKMIHEKARDLLPDLRILNIPEILVRGNGAFVAFLKDRFHSVIRDEMVDDFCDIFLSLKRVVSILYVNNSSEPGVLCSESLFRQQVPELRTPNSELLTNGAKFGRDPDLTITV